MEDKMEREIRKRLEEINEAALIISTCAKSIEYIQKDLEELEIKANSVSNNNYLGLTNIVEQLSYVIKAKSEKIVELSETC